MADSLGFSSYSSFQPYGAYANQVFNNSFPDGVTEVGNVALDAPQGSSTQALGNTLSAFIQTLNPPDLFGKLGHTTYTNGQAIHEPNNPDVLGRFLHTAGVALGYSVLSGSKEAQCIAVLTQALAQARKGTDGLSTVQNFIQGGLPLALGLLAGYPIGHVMGDSKARGDTSTIANLLLEERPGIANNIGTQTPVQVALEKTGEAHIKKAKTLLEAKKNSVTEQLKTGIFKDQIEHATDYDDAVRRFTSLRKKNKFIAAVEGASQFETEAVKQAEKLAEDLPKAITAFHDSLHELHLYDVEKMQADSATLKGLLGKHSSHVSQATISRSIKGLDDALGYIQHAQRATPGWVKTNEAFFNEATFNKQTAAFVNVRPILEDLVTDLHSKGLLTDKQQTDYRTLLNRVHDTVTSPHAKDWFSPEKLQRRMTTIEANKQKLAGLLKQFGRETMEEGLEQTIPLLQKRDLLTGLTHPITDNEKAITYLHNNFNKVLAALDESQQLHSQVLSKAGAMVGFIALANIVGPTVARTINGWLAKVWPSTNTVASTQTQGAVPGYVSPGVQTQVPPVLWNPSARPAA